MFSPKIGLRPDQKDLTKSRFTPLPFPRQAEGKGGGGHGSPPTHLFLRKGGGLATAKKHTRVGKTRHSKKASTKMK